MRARRSIAGPGLRAFAYGSAGGGEGELLERGRAWLARGPGAEDEVLKEGRVWRHGPYAVKRFEPELGVRLRLRPSRARRNAQLHFAVAPIATPRPFLVLEDRARGSLLVSEYVSGEFLHRLWNGGGPGVAAFPAFMAEMHQHGVFHGDFHLGNALWNGRAWVLLDLEGIRARRRTFDRLTLVLEQWARVHLGLRGARGLQAAFDEYLKLRRMRWSAAAVWPEIVERSRRLALARGADASYVERDGQDPAPWSSS